ncbi:MAG TPA: hypothetical protein VJ826_04110 [Candidatus Polarisedimenticolaceae bacterium]|nr:hypothetical protein [Candidatus Polarisedimenticolaceae bacterium]
MRWFSVTVKGRNCLIELDGQRRKLGFVATRFVKASDSLEARHAVLEALRVELDELLLNTDGDEPDLEIEEVSEEEQLGKPNAGFLWYFSPDV